MPKPVISQRWDHSESAYRFPHRTPIAQRQIPFMSDEPTILQFFLELLAVIVGFAVFLFIVLGA